MAQHQISPPDINWPDTRRAVKAPNATKSIASPGNYASNADLDTRLQAISSTTYTQRVLDSMTQNDKVFAVRNYDDPTSIK